METIGRVVARSINETWLQKANQVRVTRSAFPNRFYLGSLTEGSCSGAFAYSSRVRVCLPVFGLRSSCILFPEAIVNRASFPTG